MSTSSSNEGADLARALGPISLTLFGVGTVVGAGIFVLTGHAAAVYAGPAVTVSFLIGAVVCAFTALCYAELAAMLPVAGAAYSFTRYTFGQTIGWVVGWALVAEMLFAGCAVAIGWSGYVQDVVSGLGLKLPAALAVSPLALQPQGLVPTGALVNLPAVAMVLVMTGFLYAGTRESARFNAVIVMIKISAIVLFTVFGLAYAHSRNWVPFMPDRVVRADGSSAYGLGGVLKAAGIVLFAFLGFDTVATAAQETRRPERNVPIAILGALGISTLLFIGVSLAMTGLVDFHQLDTPAPLTTALAAAGPDLAWLKIYVGIAASIGLGSAVLVAIFALSRLLFAMARDGLLPVRLCSIEPRSGTPRFAVVTSGAVAAVVAGVMPIGLLGELVSTGTLMAFTMVCGAVIVLRLREPERPRPFRVPLWQVTASLGVISCLFLLLSMGFAALGRILAWQAVGLVVFAVGARTRRARAAAIV